MLTVIYRNKDASKIKSFDLESYRPMCFLKNEQFSASFSLFSSFQDNLINKYLNGEGVDRKFDLS